MGLIFGGKITFLFVEQTQPLVKDAHDSHASQIQKYFHSCLHLYFIFLIPVLWSNIFFFKETKQHIQPRVCCLLTRVENPKLSTKQNPKLINSWRFHKNKLLSEG